MTNLVWELAGEQLAEHPTVLLVDTTIPGVDHLDNVAAVSSDEALHRLARFEVAATSMVDRRTNMWDGWDTTVVIVGAGADPAPWEPIAARPDVAVVALDGRLTGGLSIVAAVDGSLTVPKWSLTVAAAALDGDTVNQVTDLLTAAEHPPVDDDMMIDPPPTDQGPGSMFEPVDDGWTPPAWPVLVRVLGAPRAKLAEADLELTPQQLSTLAFVALHREVATSDLGEAIWGGERVPEQRLRDLLSVLRRKTDPHDVIRKIDDGVVRAGDDLGCDTMLFEALNERARSCRAEWGLRSIEMIDLAAGRPFSYPGTAEQYWRWADLGQLHSIWQHRVTTVVCELAELHLTHGDAHAAIDVASHGLRVDPLSSAVTEVLIKAYAATGELAAAQRVFESHDRALADIDLGGASEETRRVYDQLFVAARVNVATGAAGDDTSGIT